MGIADKSIRSKAIQAHESGQRICTIAGVLGVHRRTVERWIKVYQTEQRLVPKPNGHKKACLSEEQLQEIEALLRVRNDLTLEAIKERLSLSCHISTLCRHLLRRDWRFKKKHFTRANKAALMYKKNVGNGKSSKKTGPLSI